MKISTHTHIQTDTHPKWKVRMMHILSISFFFSSNQWENWCLGCVYCAISHLFLLNLGFLSLLQLLFHTSSSSSSFVFLLFSLDPSIGSSAGNSLLLFMYINNIMMQKKTAMDSVSLKLSSGELLSVLDELMLRHTMWRGRVIDGNIFLQISNILWEF